MNSADITIRAARRGDLPSAAELSEAQYGGDVAARLRQFEWVLARDDAYFTVALRGNDVVGYAKVEWCDWSRRDDARGVEAGWYLGGIIVDSRERGRGIGRALTLARIEWLDTHHPGQAVWYFTDVSNGASVALHASVGFEEMTREFVVPNVAFPDGGALYRLGPYQGRT